MGRGVKSKSLTCLTQQHHLDMSFWDRPGHRCWGFVTPSSICGALSPPAPVAFAAGILARVTVNVPCQTCRSPLTTQIRPAPGSNFRITSFDNSPLKITHSSFYSQVKCHPRCHLHCGQLSVLSSCRCAVNIRILQNYRAVWGQAISTEPEMPNAN